MENLNRLGITLFVATALLVPVAVFAQEGEAADDGWLVEGFEGEDIDPGEELELDYFIDKLSPYGEWFETEQYGWVWQPNGLSDDWRPFTYGHWVYTDYGWTWVSSFPWGWAAFHYGAWAHMDGIGWVWVPAGVWSPARVIWRYHTEYVGWAPIIAGYDYWVGWDSYPVYLAHWTFITWAFFCHVQMWHHFLPHHHVYWHYHHSHFPGHCGSHAGPSCHHGPPPRKVESLSGNRVLRRKIFTKKSNPSSTNYKKNVMPSQNRPPNIEASRIKPQRANYKKPASIRSKTNPAGVPSRTSAKVTLHKRSTPPTAAEIQTPPRRTYSTASTYSPPSRSTNRMSTPSHYRPSNSSSSSGDNSSYSTGSSSNKSSSSSGSSSSRSSSSSSRSSFGSSRSSSSSSSGGMRHRK